ncbi:hypothetical protein PG999_000411 [Apiospora kogelbergensis]|uniref:Metallo-beta-lactamase domain-containing protein n=1 Tax=Apiospora kogelbergensis TaxID=1337665 RepID=A0AAW0RBN8_9PEZI
MRLPIASWPSPAAWLTLLVLATLGQGQGLSATTNFTTWWNSTNYPQEQASNVTKYIAEGIEVAGQDLYHHFQHRCIRQQIYPALASGGQSPGFVKPHRPFDSVFFVGSGFVSAWAVDTGAGLLLIDALNNPDEARTVILPGLASFGYSGADIAAILITHEHADHYGGARYLQDTFDTPVYALGACWDGIEHDPIRPEGLDIPVRNETLKDGQDLTVGNTTIHIVATPGHTAGTVSFFLPVYDRGVRHVAGLYGGGGIPKSVSLKEQQIASFAKFASSAAARGADVLMSNHASQDDSLVNFDILDHRSTENPFVIGTDAYVRYLQTMAICVRVQAARLGETLSV